MRPNKGKKEFGVSVLLQRETNHASKLLLWSPAFGNSESRKSNRPSWASGSGCRRMLGANDAESVPGREGTSCVRSEEMRLPRPWRTDNRGNTPIDGEKLPWKSHQAGFPRQASLRLIMIAIAGVPCGQITRGSPIKCTFRCPIGCPNLRFLTRPDRVSTCARGSATPCRLEHTSLAIAVVRRLLPLR